MAPNKFENHLKETFDKRTLKPSADAWNRLSERLETAPKKKNNSSYWWLGLAASLIGVLLVTTFFIKKENVELNNPVDRKSTRLNSSHVKISYAVFCLKKKTNQ